MAKLNVFTIPFRTYQSGPTDIPPTGVATDAIMISMTFDISQMTDPATSFDAPLEVSNDGGQTWDGWARFGRTGGPVPVDRNGNPVTTFLLQGPLPKPATPQTRIRGTVTVVGPITIGGTIESR